jgi:hypothetical protein
VVEQLTTDTWLRRTPGYQVVNGGLVDHLFEPQQSAEIGRLVDQAATPVLGGALIRSDKEEKCPRFPGAKYYLWLLPLFSSWDRSATSSPRDLSLRNT